MVLQLLPFQRQGVDFLVSKPVALLADEPGLGKTIQAIKAAEVLRAKKILVVCPAIVKLNWQKECNRWLNTPLKIQILFGRNDKIKADTDILIVNYDLLISSSIFAQLIKLKFAVGIFDESHFLKNRQAKRTKAVLTRGGIASRCVYKWFLTGTPILNRPIELFPLLKSVAPEVIEPYTTYELYAKHFCDAWWDGFQLVTTGASNTTELAIRLKRGFMLRRLKKDHLKELPAKRYQLISLPAADTKIKSLIKKEFSFTQGEAKFVKVGADGAEVAKIRHDLALSKLDTCVQHIENLMDEVSKVVIFAYHRDVIKLLHEKLREYNPLVITGEVSATDRHTLVETFQTQLKHRIFIGQIQASGVGITLTAASHVVFVESSWVPGEIDQAVDRCHRIGQQDSVLIQFLVIEESLEEHMIRTVIDKRQTIKDILDLDKETAYLFT